MRTIFSTVVCAALMITSTAAFAEEAEARDTTYVDRLNEGHRLYANNEHEAARRAYQAALDARSGDALATYLIACTHRATGDLDEALSMMRRAAEQSGDDHALHARILMNIAFIQEARRDFEAARTAWRAYITFAESHQSIPTYEANARQRLDAITSYEELDATYGPVRQRIEARAASQASGGN